MEMALRLHDATIRQVLAKHSGYEAWTRFMQPFQGVEPVIEIPIPIRDGHSK